MSLQTQPPTYLQTPPDVVNGADGGPPPTRPHRVSGLLAVLGAVVMVGGAVLHTAFGADLFVVMEGRSAAVAADLAAVAEHSTALTAGTIAWLVGAPLMCVAGVLLVRGDDGAPAAVARWAFAAATGAVLVFFTMMIGIIEVLAPAHVAGEDVVTVTLAVGLGAALADWLATFLILAVGYGCVVLSRRGRGAPRWLLTLAGATAVVGLVGFVPWLPPVVGMLLVVVGLALVVSTGVLTLRGRL